MSAQTLVEICDKEELARYMDNATKTAQLYARRILDLEKSLAGIRDYAQRQVDASEQEALLWALVVSKCDEAIISRATGIRNVILDYENAIEQVNAYFRRVRKLGGDTGECNAEAIVAWLASQHAAPQETK